MFSFNISIWLIFLGLTIFSFIVSYIRAYIDERIIKKLWGKVKFLVHWTRGLITILIFVLIDLLVFKIEWKTLFIFSYQWFWYSFYFDIILNRMRNLNDWYVGQTSTMDIMVRKTFGMNSGRIYGMIKIVFVIFSTIGIIML